MDVITGIHAPEYTCFASCLNVHQQRFHSSPQPYIDFTLVAFSGSNFWGGFSRQLFDGRQAFEDLDGLEAAKAAAFDGARPEFKNAFIPRKVKDLIVSLWHMDPLKRPKMQDVVCRLEGVERTMALPTRSQASAAGGRYSSNFGQGLSVLQGPDLFDSIFGTKQRRQIARTWNTMWGSCMPDLQPPRTLTRTAARAKQYATNELVER